jgi:hypothetical protein
VRKNSFCSKPTRNANVGKALIGSVASCRLASKSVKLDSSLTKVGVFDKLNWFLSVGILLAVWCHLFFAKQLIDLLIELVILLLSGQGNFFTYINTQYMRIKCHTC